ncbi:MAG: amino acid permease [Candidatus Aminicenantes bacterium]|nr:amino acid permease [Candidatus Aminicenantes bacterium]
MAEYGSEGGLARRLGVFDASNIVIGSMIGSGIFLSPSLMAGYIQTPGILILLWLTGGVLTMLGALSMGELSAAFPRAGGQYVFLREAFSPLGGFLFGWTFFLVVQSGFIAAVAIAFSKYLGVFFPFLGEGQRLFSLDLFGRAVTLSTAQAAAILCIVLLTVVNVRGVRAGASLQNVFTLTKVAAIVVLAVAAFLFFKGRLVNFTPLLKPILPAASTLPLFAAMAVAMSKALFAYDAWNSVAFVAEEVREPQRNIPRAMFLGTGIVTLVYTLITMAYLYVIPAAQMAGVEENRIGAAVAQAVMGQAGLVFITIAILVSTFGCVNGLVLSGPRLYYAMARDGMFFKKNCRIHAKFRTPHVALVYQAVWSCILVLSGTFNDLLTYTAFASLLFNAVTVIGLFKLRWQRPELQRPYRVSGYPIVPLLYVGIALFFIVYIIVGDPLNSGKGLFLILTGVPVFFYWKRKKAS